HGGRSDSLFAAIDARVGGDRTPYRDQGSEDEALHAEALTDLLIHARRALSSYPKLSLDFPAGEMTDAIMAAGFKPHRTLIWMRAQRDE
ncbi:MAG: hypothetical protein ABIU06_03020, partial [Anaerolineales bacterium]